ncbi:hypothetical protein SR1949_44060 [Sphaerospermopsis reniformis]|uniref:Filamentous hemagglutinin outer membrane protein n=1 Tax=Sphaerospermopsis reniformis TaxID=531300 RepID=A0A480A7V0_9CYAN|nr:hypothetical protein [Sphaerospermopsis reniformis]GCL39281.1 hypothetical protein SR1949_44060 [Sphaerospermopsis reniformis]
MLKIKSQLLVAAAVVAGSFGFANSAFAGEGGVAGAASFQLNAGQVTEASSAVAVGKSTAYAGAVTNGAGTEAFAAGNGGAITLNGNSVYIQSIAQDTALVNEQANQLDNNDVQIDVKVGTVKVINTP